MNTFTSVVCAGIVLCLLAGCFTKGPITRRSELTDPVETGAIKLITVSGERYVLSSYRVDDAVLVGSGMRVDRDSAVAFFGSLPLSSISYIHTANPNAMKIFVGIAGIAIFSALVADQTKDGPAAINGVVGYHYPWGPVSCPYLYSYDGGAYRFASETYAGAVMKNAERSAHDVLMQLADVDGIYRLRLTNERPETHYTNLVALRAVDAPRGIDVIAGDDGALHSIGERIPPSSAVDYSERPTCRALAADDSLVWRSDISRNMFLHREDFTDGIIAAFPKPRGVKSVKLLVKGKNTELASFAFTRLFALKGSAALDWYSRLETSPAEAEKLLGFMRQAGMLRILVWEGGTWVERGRLHDVGPMIEKEQLAVLDCSHVDADTLRIKLESATDLWIINAVCVDYTEESPLRVRTCEMLSAVTGEGATVRTQLAHDDGAYFCTVNGDYADIVFAAPPPVDAGYGRRYIVTTKGYYHLWFNGRGEDRSMLVDRMLTEKEFGARLMMPEWKKRRASAGE